MEAFDVIHVLNRLHGLTHEALENAYLHLIQAQSFDESADPMVTGLICFYRVQNPEFAVKIESCSVGRNDLINELNKYCDQLPESVITILDRVFASSA